MAKISFSKTANLANAYDTSGNYLTANNINEIITSINSLYDIHSNFDRYINDKLTTVSGSISTNISNLTDALQTDINLANTNINTLSTDFTKKIERVENNISNVEEQIPDSNLIVKNALTADVALDLSNDAKHVLSTTIIDVINNDSTGDTSTGLSDIKNLYFQISNNTENNIRYDGRSSITVSKILSSVYSSNADTADMLNHQLTIHTKDDIEAFTGENDVEIDSILSSKYAINAVNADKVNNILTFKTGGADIEYNGSEQKIIDTILSANYALTAMYVVNSNSVTTDFNISTIQFLGGSTNKIYDGSTNLTIDTIRFADNLTHDIQFVTGINTDNNTVSYMMQTLNDRTGTIRIDKILSSEYSNISVNSTTANKLNHQLRFLNSSHEFKAFDGTNDITLSVYDAYSANTDNIGNNIVNTYQFKDKQFQETTATVYGITDIFTQSNLNQLTNINYIAYDNNNMLLSNSGILIGCGKTPYNGFNGQLLVSQLNWNTQQIHSINNIQYVYTLNNQNLLIANNQLFVWGRADNCWFGNNKHSTDLLTPIKIQSAIKPKTSLYDTLYRITKNGSVWKTITNNYKSILYTSIVHNCQQIQQVGWKKAIKCPIGGGALALSNRNELYGCGINANNIFGTQFKTDEIFKQFVYLPINYIITAQYIVNQNNQRQYDSIKDIKIACYNDIYTILLLTKQGRVYIHGYFNNYRVKKVPIYTAVNTEILNFYHNVEYNSTVTTVDIEATRKTMQVLSGMCDGWYIWGCNTTTNQSYWFDSVDLTPSAIIGIDTTAGILFEGANELFVSGSHFIDNIFIYTKDNETSTDFVSEVYSFNTNALPEVDLYLTNTSIILKFKQLFLYNSTDTQLDSTQTNYAFSNAISGIITTTASDVSVGTNVTATNTYPGDVHYVTISCQQLANNTSGNANISLRIKKDSTDDDNEVIILNNLHHIVEKATDDTVNLTYQFSNALVMYNYENVGVNDNKIIKQLNVQNQSFIIIENDAIANTNAQVRKCILNTGKASVTVEKITSPTYFNYCVEAPAKTAITGMLSSVQIEGQYEPITYISDNEFATIYYMLSNTNTNSITTDNYNTLPNINYYKLQSNNIVFNRLDSTVVKYIIYNENVILNSTIYIAVYDENDNVSPITTSNLSKTTIDVDPTFKYITLTYYNINKKSFDFFVYNNVDTAKTDSIYQIYNVNEIQFDFNKFQNTFGSFTFPED